MVVGKVKSNSMGMQRSSGNVKPKTDASADSPLLSASSSVKHHRKYRETSAYFPRFSTDVSELLRVVEELRESELRLKAQLSEQKLIEETVSVVPVLENVISSKDLEIEGLRKKIGCLEAENEKLRQENEFLHVELRKQNQKHEEKIKRMATDEFSSSRNAAVDKYNRKGETRRISGEIPEASNGLTRMKSRVPHVPKPPPASAPSPSKRILSHPACHALAGISIPPPPTPPPPPPRLVKPAAPPPPANKGLKPLPVEVNRVPEVVEFYHSVMRRDSTFRKGGGGAISADAQAAADTTKDMIGEIKTRSTHLLAIKMDVETQGDFIRLLIEEVDGAAFTDIESVVVFVQWLDDQLLNLVDERAVLKHFNWPEKKADSMREAAFGYCDLRKLETEVSSFLEDPRQPCSHALKKMQSLFEKLEHGVYKLSRMRESAAERYRGFQIPVDWMLDTGCASQMKLASVKLAMKYMKRVSAELETVSSGPEEQALIVQGVKFAFRVHQFAGGFDAETMRAFQELRAKAR